MPGAPSFCITCPQALSKFRSLVMFSSVTMSVVFRVPPYPLAKVRVPSKKTRVGCFLNLRVNLTVQTLYANVQPFPQINFEALWPLLTSAALCLGTCAYLRLRLSQLSPGKNANLHPMHPPHLPPCAQGSGRVSFCCANSPAHSGLVCGFCSSGRDFAAGFLQIPPRDGHPCLWLTLLAVKRVADFHRQVCAHAGRTKSGTAGTYDTGCAV
mgnify:FL=1